MSVGVTDVPKLMIVKAAIWPAELPIFVVLPFKSCPLVFKPQHFIVAVVDIAQLVCRPKEIF